MIWCPQEVVGDERSALQAVVAADAELMELREEEEQLNKQLQDSSLEDKPKGFDADDASERLNEVRWTQAEAWQHAHMPQAEVSGVP